MHGPADPWSTPADRSTRQASPRRPVAGRHTGPYPGPTAGQHPDPYSGPTAGQRPGHGSFSRRAGSPEADHDGSYPGWSDATETLDEHPGHRGRHRGTPRLPGPLGLGLLVAVLLVAFGTGAALLPPSFADGPPGSAAADPDDGPGVVGLAADHAREHAPALTVPGTPTVKPRRTPSASRSPAPIRTARPAPSPAATRGPGPPTRPTSSPPPPARPVPTGVPALEDEVTELVNQERARAGCAAVRTDERLRAASRGHSQDMADNNYFSHDSLDGRSPWDRAHAAGYPQPIGENIAKGQRTPADVMRAWMNSPGHRNNILNCRAKATGVGLAYDGGTPVWTQLFGAA